MIDVVDQFAPQLLEIDRARAQNRERVLVLGQRQQQVLERGVFVPPLIGVSEGAVKGLFKVARQHTRLFLISYGLSGWSIAGSAQSFSKVHCNGC